MSEGGLLRRSMICDVEEALGKPSMFPVGIHIQSVILIGVECLDSGFTYAASYNFSSSYRDNM